ncbi:MULTISPECIES: SLATT domain-containing protein [Methylomonas]|uniref:SMODS and SLOG-associating 2TM effector domain-containing protein n=2 Tax=Methylomonas TaxID=416 RepID=A0A126T1I1_9GAMM|nr:MULTISPECIES: SLATT domain-containing protein [Methylomonas]AMK75938.1 hypothetical protein JT25_005445 [Methylomonas denitrificans]OAI02046.1 hypothetical protein A1342_03675 [Methylomonas methanica]TCV84045.1 hypothetical protein EDE11_108177 [Methylomonas methanica]
MDKNDLLKHIAETGYNVGFGAKKHFATYDIVDKLPGLIGFVSTAVGIFSLFIDVLTDNYLSATFIVLGICGLYISFYDATKIDYETSAKEITKIFNDLKRLYYKAKSAKPDDLAAIETELMALENKYYQVAISKQILFSDWYAHYKFFWQHQIGWIEEQKTFSFLRDKIPLSFSFFVLILVVVFGSCLAQKFFQLCATFNFG